MSTLTCARAAAGEIPACLALLPETWNRPAHWLIARQGGAFVGAAAVVWREGAEPGGFPLWIRVPAEQRRRGVGRALAAAAEDLVRFETNGLWTMNPVPDGSAAAGFLRATGFTATVRELHFQVESDRMLGNLRRLTVRARARGGLADVELVGLAAAPLEPVAWLVSRSLGGGPLASLEGARRRVAPQEGENRDRSLVAMRGGEVVGAILWRAEGGVAMVDARVVAEAWRGSWLNLLMLEAGLERCLTEGLTHVRFHCDDTVRDTVMLARRGEAETVLSQARWRRPIAA